MNIPIPAETPDPNIDDPTLPPGKPEPIPEKEPPENQPPPVEEPPTTMQPVIVRNAYRRRVRFSAPGPFSASA